MIELDWEGINDQHKRAKVVGGWLVKAYENRHISMHEEGMRPEPGYEWQVSMCFVPDASYSWNT